MIEAYELESLLKKYGIDASKVLSKNDTILDRGKYQDIDKTLNYLINELGINPRNIEKCPSIMYYGGDNIRGNYEFLIKQGVNISSIETTLHILCADPQKLKETYYYVYDNYGKNYINRATSILRVPVSRIIAIEKILSDKSLIISTACSWKNIDEIEEIIVVCKKNDISITSNVFLRTADEIKKIINTCKKYNISITSSVFFKTANEIEEIVGVCKKYNISITGSVFLKTANEMEKIVGVCKKHNLPVTGSVFYRTANEIEKIVSICKKNNIPTIGNVFHKTADEIEQIIDVCNENKIPITGGIFLKQADEIVKIIMMCKKNNIPITGSVFLKTANEIEEIVGVCKKYNISITGSVFLKTADEIEKIVAICNENDIPITGGIFLKTADELKKSIEYVKSTYGEAYLKPLIVNKNVEYLKTVLPYLDSLNVLPVVIKSASILSLTLDEIMERKEYIDSHDGELVLSNGRFNSIFGLSRVNYRKLVGKTRSI